MDEGEEEEDEELADENAVKRMAITRVASAKSEMTANVHEGGATSSDPSNMARSRSAPEMPGYLAPDAVAADILRHEPEQETFVRLRINATGGDKGNGMGMGGEWDGMGWDGVLTSLTRLTCVMWPSALLAASSDRFFFSYPSTRWSIQ